MTIVALNSMLDLMLPAVRRLLAVKKDLQKLNSAYAKYHVSDSNEFQVRKIFVPDFPLLSSTIADVEVSYWLNVQQSLKLLSLVKNLQ